MIDRLRITGRSLRGRVFLVQTLGAPNGYLADAVAAAAGVDEVLVPERPYDLDAVAARLGARAAAGAAIAVMSEAVGDAVDIAAQIADRADLRVHPTILGHAQRGLDSLGDCRRHRHPDVPPRVGFAWLDPMCGLMLGFIVAAALWQRRRHGGVTRVDFSMIEAVF